MSKGKGPRRSARSSAGVIANSRYGTSAVGIGALNKQFGVSGNSGFSEIGPGVFHSPVGFSPEELKAKTSGLIQGDRRKTRRSEINVAKREWPKHVSKDVRDMIVAFLSDRKVADRVIEDATQELYKTQRKSPTFQVGPVSFVLNTDTREVQFKIKRGATAEQVRQAFEVRYGRVKLPVQEALHHNFLRSTYKDTLSHLVNNSSQFNQPLRNYQMMLRRAERFDITNDALEEVYFLSQNVDKMYERSGLARLPFQEVWIEFDLHRKIWLSREYGTAMLEEGFDKDNYEHIPKRAGFLMKQLHPDRPDAWVAFKITDMTDVASGVQPLGLLFDAESVAEPKGVNGWDSYRELIRFNLMEEVGEKVPSHADMMQWAWGVFGHAQPAAMERLAEMSTYLVEPLWRAVFDSASGRDVKHQDNIAKVFAEGVRENSGDLRFLVTLLAFINEVPIRYDDVKSRGSFTAQGRMQSYFSHRTVAVNIPAKTRRSRRSEINKLIKAAVKIHKRRHKVRGHMRRIYKGQVLFRETWVKPHERGDKALGWVHQDWEVRAD